jgi:biopolymer transport protein ExbB/TolQ
MIRNLVVNKLTHSIRSFFGSSLFWGPLAAIGFYSLIHAKVLDGPFYQRYFTSHWVLYAETILFFIGVAELLLKLFDVTEQRGRIGRPLWTEPLEGIRPASDANQMVAQLSALTERDQETTLVRRVRDALDTIVRHKSADRLDEELKYLSDAEAGRVHSSYALMRIVIWAIPILGFLGTVIGITEAIGQLNPTALEQSLESVTFGLGIAFDTTALALTLSMILMFGQFLTDKLDQRLLSEVDLRVANELSGRFERGGETVSRDPQVTAVADMSQIVLQSTEKLVQKQAEVWQRTIEAAQRRWNEAAEQTHQQLETSLIKAMQRGVQSHAETLAKAETDAAAKNRKHWGRLLRRMNDNTDTLQQQHVEIVRQTEILLQVVEATGQVTKLEDTLNRNLASLAGAEHFHDTILNLAAAINLLNARLGSVAPLAKQVDLKVSKAA